MLESFKTNPLRLDYIRLFTFIVIILIGGVVFAVLIPKYEIIDWLDLLFYSLVSILIFAYFIISLIVKRKKIAMVMSALEETENVPSSGTSTKLNVRQKAGVKADESAASYCPRCKSSFTKTYQFCPNCSYCGIIKKLK